MQRLLIRWLITALSLYVAVQLIPGLRFSGPWWGLLIVAAIFGLVNALVRPLVALLTCPLVVLTLGLFILVINAAMLGLTAWLAGSWLDVAGFWPAFFGGLVVSVVSFLLNWLLGVEDKSKRD
jgi:putative membrane protein